MTQTHMLSTILLALTLTSHPTNAQFQWKMNCGEHPVVSFRCCIDDEGNPHFICAKRYHTEHKAPVADWLSGFDACKAEGMRSPDRMSKGRGDAEYGKCHERFQELRPQDMEEMASHKTCYIDSLVDPQNEEVCGNCLFKENGNMDPLSESRFPSFDLLHTECRTSPYVNTQQTRFPVPDEKVEWNTEFADYKPPFFTDPKVVGNPLTDASLEKMKADDSIKFKFNELDGIIDRRSHEGRYELDGNLEDLPLNPHGRTGLTGRGWLWRWGPNHAADPIVTRWLRTEGEIVKDEESGKPVLEFVAILRNDGGGWAIPGGMVDPGELVSRTLKREFGEEAMDTMQIKEEDKAKAVKMIDAFFSESGVEVYRGYVDDPRNTDNAWMETVAFNFHDADGDKVGKFSLRAGDDAGSVKWMTIDRDLDLYPSHHWLLQRVVQLHKAHW